MRAKFQVCIIFRLATRRDTNTYTHTYTSELNNILGGCSPHVDFENKEDSGCNINTNTHIRTLTQLTV